MARKPDKLPSYEDQLAALVAEESDLQSQRKEVERLLRANATKQRAIEEQIRQRDALQLGTLVQASGLDLATLKDLLAQVTVEVE